MRLGGLHRQGPGGAVKEPPRAYYALDHREVSSACISRCRFADCGHHGFVLLVRLWLPWLDVAAHNEVEERIRFEVDGASRLAARSPATVVFPEPGGPLRIKTSFCALPYRTSSCPLSYPGVVMFGCASGLNKDPPERKGTPSRWRFHPPSLLTVRPGPCGLPRSISGGDLDLLALRAR